MNKNRFLMILMLLGLGAWLVTLTGEQAARATAPQSIQGTDLSDDPDWAYPKNNDSTVLEEGNELGCAVSGAGDVNGDGIADAIIGADKFSLVDFNGGAAFLFYGSYLGLSESYDWAAGGMKGSLYGSAVSGAGNINGDKSLGGKPYDDIIVGAPYFIAGDKMPEAGAVYVYYGSGGGPGSAANWQYVSEQRDARLGWSVGAAGDVNGDTFADIIVGAPLYEDTTVMTPTLSEGAAFVFYGSADGLPDRPDWAAYGGKVGAYMGRSVSGAGDVNGDGYDDIIAGAPGYAGIGRADVFLGGDEGEDGGLEQTPAWSILGPAAGAGFGYAVAGAGDVNGDHFDDVIVSAPGYVFLVNGIELKGAAYVYLGSAQGLSATPAATLNSSQVSALFGYRVAGAGDVNDDGYDDVLVSAPQYDGDQPAEGAVFLYYGNPLGVSSRAGFTAYGDKADAELGWGLGGGSDFNFDGFADIIAGAPPYKMDDKTPVGRAMAYYGDDSGDPGGIIATFLPLVNR